MTWGYWETIGTVFTIFLVVVVGWMIKQAFAPGWMEDFGAMWDRWFR